MKGYVYQIVCLNDPSIIYIGSTITTLSRRMAKHRSEFKKFINGNSKGYCSIFSYFKELGIENFKIIELGRYDISDKQELKKYEQEYILKFECVNKYRAFLSEEERKEERKQRNKIYISKNKDKIREYKNDKDNIKGINKKYYETHKDVILHKYKQKIHCSQCSKEITKKYLKTHLKKSCKGTIITNKE